jgi:hypothetical protein
MAADYPGHRVHVALQPCVRNHACGSFAHCIWTFVGSVIDHSSLAHSLIDPLQPLPPRRVPARLGVDDIVLDMDVQVR